MRSFVWFLAALLLILLTESTSKHRQGEKALFWTRVARNLPLLDSFHRENDKTKSNVLTPKVHTNNSGQ